MQIFKLTPTPQSDYRLEVRELQKKCKIEKHGFRHNKIIYGFCHELPDMAVLLSLGINIEEIIFDEAQLSLTNDLIERGRLKSKIDHLQFDREENGANNAKAEAAAQQTLTDLNDKIQSTKEALGITGTLKILKF
jgi:hypothetical protein